MILRKTILLGLIAGSIFACKPEEEIKEETTQESADVESASAVLGEVNENMLPASLTTELSSLRLEGDNPCEGTDGFFDCQPNMLKLYLAIAKTTTGSINQILAEAGAGVAALGTSEGTFEPNDGEGISKLDYKITSSTEYELLFHTDAGPFMYLSVDGNVYELKGDMGNAPDNDGGGGVIHSTVTFTDEDNFDVDVRILGMPCEDSDVRAPGNIAVKVHKESGVWQGKAMLYLPRWLTGDGADCSLEPSDETKLFLYTDFVGNDASTTAALYMANATVTTSGQLADWTAADFCGNWSTACNNGYSFGDPNPVATYENNFCVSNESTAWGSNCGSDEGLISNGDFGSADDWILPAELGDLNSDLPTSL